MRTRVKVGHLFRALFRSAASRPRTPVSLPTYGGSGLRPGVDVVDKEAIIELLDHEDQSDATG